MTDPRFKTFEGRGASSPLGGIIMSAPVVDSRLALHDRMGWIRKEDSRIQAHRLDTSKLANLVSFGGTVVKTSKAIKAAMCDRILELDSSLMVFAEVCPSSPTTAGEDCLCVEDKVTFHTLMVVDLHRGDVAEPEAPQSVEPDPLPTATLARLVLGRPQTPVAHLVRLASRGEVKNGKVEDDDADALSATSLAVLVLGRRPRFEP